MKDSLWRDAFDRLISNKLSLFKNSSISESNLPNITLLFKKLLKFEGLKFK